jgi:hypothetical protein
MAHQVQWGTIILILDNEAFHHGFLAARRWYVYETELLPMIVLQEA